MNLMKDTEKNMKMAKEVIDILAENNCTVSEALEILDYVTRQIPQGSLVKSTKNCMPEK
jgi:hypothetical protein